ncbi:MAG: hypothetical protein J7J61_06595 [Candidatus Hydrothermae bacterium]|nr:hypothetical protein [Candidatus Hydrothermae bacterium]
MEGLRHYTREEIKAFIKEGKAIEVNRADGVVWVRKSPRRAYVCTYNPGLGVYTNCFVAPVKPSVWKAWQRG